MTDYNYTDPDYLKDTIETLYLKVNSLEREMQRQQDLHQLKIKFAILTERAKCAVACDISLKELNAIIEETQKFL